MIYEVKMFSIKCDNCGEQYEEHHNGWSAMADENLIWEAANNDDWIMDEDDNDKHYCPDCYIYDEEDNLIIKSKLNPSRL